MIKVENLSYSFPQTDLYNNISFLLEEGQHCAFIGSSGSGKSTLVDIIMRPDDFMYDGTLEIAPDCRIGYVSQFYQRDNDKDITVFQYIAKDFIQIQERIAAICVEMETATDLESLMEQYQEALDAFDAIGGDDFESIVNKKLGLANLSKHENLPIANLSGGEFKLVQVIREMLNTPDLLIMDEPDGFLDFENINALKDLINAHKGTLLVITHNRYLLNHCFDKILHLENKELQEFDGSYIDYNFSLLQKKIELQELATADTLEIERNAVIVNRLRTIATVHTEASRGKSLKARKKVLERLEARRIKAPFVEINQPKINLKTNNPLEDTLALEADNYTVSFDELLLQKVSFQIGATDKVAIVGANGTGKTTLLRDLYQSNKESIKYNEQVEVAYLSQVQDEMLNEENTILDEFFDLGFKTNDEIISYVGNFGFTENIVRQKIRSLSGGEKNILQLAKISAGSANLLLLDEPTSHLDTYAQAALEEAIKNYNGAIIMVSHDFYSIVNSMDYVLIIEDKSIRKTSIKRFKKMIYSKYFDRSYLELEEQKKEIELKISYALKENNFELAKVLSEELEEIVVKMI